MLKLALDGFWLVGALGAAFIAGVFLSGKVKDWLFGVPADLRAALKSAESNLSAQIMAAQKKVVADAVKTLAPVMPTVVKPAPAAPPAPAPALAPAPQA
jgi:hypothetical protein